MSFWINHTKTLYKKVFLTMAIIIAVVFIGLYFFKPNYAFSYLIGALIGWIPQILFVGFLIFKGLKTAQINKVKVLYQAEIFKICITILFFVMLFVFDKTVSPLGLFSGYLGVIFLNNLLLFRLRNSNKVIN
ncbi:ATP synthase subunit I [Gallibacterium anatis]|uniref:ATP synthase subunit I n=2 Tax=Gallibacterium anatis TaxID=750 RepID=UPI0005312D02|nr:ATP synthase subunit I [Gallibacterium anatis]KGQ45798.1 ATP F0F1 synthase subunit I [Gallibacterium anatis]KGQ69028.1 ATP F0F1 synthase subunit I [Gallibacterium anatis]MDK9560116.1 ATP synthase subunit I [Gallibacterium anatis]